MEGTSGKRCNRDGFNANNRTPYIWYGCVFQIHHGNDLWIFRIIKSSKNEIVQQYEND